MYTLTVSCEFLSNPVNGIVGCNTREDGVALYEDVCFFSCNTGYELTGSSERTCQSDGSWSRSPVSCTIMECLSSSLPMNSMLAESCSSTYQSMCELQCQEGFNGTGDPSYVCDVLSDGSSVMWIGEEETWRCERGTYNHNYNSFNNHLCIVFVTQSSVPVYHHPLMVISHVILLVYHILKIIVYSHVILDIY